MYNNMRRCLNTSTNLYRRLSPQSIHESILPSEIDVRDTRQNHMVHTRFYCQAVNIKKTSQICKEEFQRQLDEAISDPETNKRFKILQLEVDVMRHNAEKVPEKIEAKDWLLILKSTSRSQRRKSLNYMWRIEKSKEHEREQKALRKAEWLSMKKEEEQSGVTDELKYGLAYNSLFLRFYDKTMNFYQNARLLRTMMFEPKIVFDCGYDSYMTQRESHNCAKQLTLAFAKNRSHIDPMCLYFCNLNSNGLLTKFFETNVPNLMDVDFPAIVTSQSYLDLFPKDQLVYLTPHCRINMTKYDPELVYIIGAMVDKIDPQPISMAKAKKEGIRMARLPVDQYLEWGSGSSKSFTLNQVLSIILDLRHTRNWNEALKNVPSRKLKACRELQLQKKIEKFSEKSNEIKNKIPIDFTFTNRKLC